MARVPELEPHCNSWVIVNRATGKAVLETRNRSVVIAVNEAAYEVLTALQWLVRINGKTRK